MFGSQIEDRDREHFPELCEAGDEAYNELRLTISDGIDQGVFRHQPLEEVAFATWAMVHGLAHLTLDCARTDVPDNGKHYLIERSLQIVLMGLCH